MKYKGTISDIGSIVINFLRPEVTIKCLESLRNQAPHLKIYVGDQDDDNELLKDYCKSRKINYIKLPFDCGIGVSRNTLVEHAKSDGCKYIMWGDNDFVYDSRFRLQNALTILNKDKKVGIVGGTILKNEIVQHYERIIYYNKFYKTACFIPLEYTYPDAHYAKKVDYYYCDMTFNFCVARIEIFNEKVQWDNDIKVKFEHSFFFLKYLQYNKMRVAYCPSIMVKHEHGKCEIYNKYRNRVSDGDIYAKKLNLKTGFAINEPSWNHTNQNQFDFRRVAIESPTFISALKHNHMNESIKKTTNKQVDKKLSFYNILNIIQYLKEKNINFVIVDKSCLQAVRNGKFFEEGKVLYIATFNVALHEILINDGFIRYSENGYSLGDYKIIFSIYSGNTKKFMVEYEEINVPFPVISYLAKTFGNKWKTIDMS